MQPPSSSGSGSDDVARACVTDDDATDARQRHGHASARDAVLALVQQQQAHIVTLQHALHLAAAQLAHSHRPQDSSNTRPCDDKTMAAATASPAPVAAAVAAASQLRAVCTALDAQRDASPSPSAATPTLVPVLVLGRRARGVAEAATQTCTRGCDAAVMTRATSAATAASVSRDNGRSTADAAAHAAEVAVLRRELASAVQRATAMAADAREACAAAETRARRAEEALAAVCADVHARERQAAQQHAARDRELRRLRVLMRFSELKKDSDALAGAHAQLRDVEQQRDAVQRAYDALLARTRHAQAASQATRCREQCTQTPPYADGAAAMTTTTAAATSALAAADARRRSASMSSASSGSIAPTTTPSTATTRADIAATTALPPTSRWSRVAAGSGVAACRPKLRRPSSRATDRTRCNSACAAAATSVSPSPLSRLALTSSLTHPSRARHASTPHAMPQTRRLRVLCAP